MKRTSLIGLLLISVTAYAQDVLTGQSRTIVIEGKRLYRSEMASWYGTDLFLQFYKDTAKIQGYFSYEAGNRTICVFYSKSEQPKVIGEISFDSTFITQTAGVRLEERQFNSFESEIYAIREKTLDEINGDTATFRRYENTHFNLVPLIDGEERKVYVLTGPAKPGVVIFGNDYLISFDSSGALVSKKTLHKNIIPIEFGGKEEVGKQVEGTLHTHSQETGDLITPTDVCTLMLYEKFAKWKRHNVVSKNYVCVWNCELNKLDIFTIEAFKKIKHRPN